MTGIIVSFGEREKNSCLKKLVYFWLGELPEIENHRLLAGSD